MSHFGSRYQIRRDSGPDRPRTLTKECWIPTHRFKVREFAEDFKRSAAVTEAGRVAVNGSEGPTPGKPSGDDRILFNRARDLTESEARKLKEQENYWRPMTTGRHLVGPDAHVCATSGGELRCAGCGIVGRDYRCRNGA
jgi:hypothetical protein